MHRRLVSHPVGQLQVRARASRERSLTNRVAGA